MSDRPWTPGPWTPGPWAVDISSCGGGISRVAPERDDNGHYVRIGDPVFMYQEHGCEGHASWTASNFIIDASLIAMSPEMAELILSIADSKQMSDGFCGEMPDDMREAIEAMADHIRQIGGTP